MAKQEYSFQVQFTYRNVAALLGMPIDEQIRCVDIYTDSSRDVVTLKFVSDEWVSSRAMRTFGRAEGQEYCNQDHTFDWLVAYWEDTIKKMRERGWVREEFVQEIHDKNLLELVRFEEVLEAQAKAARKNQEEKDNG